VLAKIDEPKCDDCRWRDMGVTEIHLNDGTEDPKPRTPWESLASLPPSKGQKPSPPADGTKPPRKSLRRRIAPDREHLFVFVTDSAVPPTNNVSERALRPSVIFRKVTNGFRSEWGAQTYAAFRSVVSTSAPPSSTNAPCSKTCAACSTPRQPERRSQGWGEQLRSNPSVTPQWRYSGGSARPRGARELTTGQPMHKAGLSPRPMSS